VRAHVPAHDSAKYSIAKFPAVRPRANAPASRIAGVLLAAVTAGSLALRVQGPPGFKGSREAAWQLAHEATQGVRAASGADGCAAHQRPTHPCACQAAPRPGPLQPCWCLRASACAAGPREPAAAGPACWGGPADGAACARTAKPGAWQPVPAASALSCRACRSRRAPGSAWVLEERPGGPALRGQREGSLGGAAYFVLTREGADFVAVPVAQWISFRPQRQCAPRAPRSPDALPLACPGCDQRQPSPLGACPRQPFRLLPPLAARNWLSLRPAQRARPRPAPGRSGSL